MPFIDTAKTKLKNAGNYIVDIDYRKGFKAAYEGTKSTVKSPWVQGITAGTVGLITLYNIIDNGLDRGMENAREDIAEGYDDLFESSMTAGHENNLRAKTKKFVTGKLFDNGIYPFYQKVKNGILGIANEALDNWINITAVTAVAVPLIKNRGKEMADRGRTAVIIPAVAATYLLYKSVKTFVVDILGFFKNEP